MRELTKLSDYQKILIKITIIGIAIVSWLLSIIIVNNISRNACNDTLEIDEANEWIEQEREKL